MGNGAGGSGSGSAPGVRLPDGAPEALREFVACRASSVELDPGDADWIPAPPGLPDGARPSVTIEPGSTSTSGTITVGWGFVSITLPVSIVDGRLVVYAGDLPFGIGPEITRWVDRFNATLAGNGKQLDGFAVRDGTATVTKRDAVPATEPDTAGATGAAAGVGAAGGATGDTPPADDDAAVGETPPEKKTGCLAWVAGGLAALAAAVGITWAATSGGDDGEITTGPAATEASAPATEPPATEPPATDPVTTDPVSTDPAAEPDEAPDGDADQVGSADTDDAGDATRVACGSPEGSGVGTPDPAGWWWAVDEVPACDTPPDDAYALCAPDVLPCSSGPPPPLVIPGSPGVTHRGSAPDAITGATGPSEARHPLFVLAGGDGQLVTVQVGANCSGQTVTGRAEVASPGVVEVPHPLFSFGPCVATDLQVVSGEVAWSLPPSMLADGGVYTIDAAETPPGDPLERMAPVQLIRDRLFDDIVDELYEPEIWEWDDAAGTVRDVTAGGPIIRDCVWFTAGARPNGSLTPVEGCEDRVEVWQFAAASAAADDDLFLSGKLPFMHAGRVVNGSHPAVDTLFGNTIYPCGAGHVGWTVCPDGPGAGSPPPDGAPAFVSVALVSPEPLPLEPDADAPVHEVDFSPIGGPAYRVAPGDGGWTLTGPDGTTARAVIRHDSLTFFVPGHELPVPDADATYRYVLRTEIDGAVVEQPEAHALSRSTLPDVGPTEGAVDDPAGGAVDERVEDFYSRLAEGLRSGDITFPLERLHPLVLEAYPDQCPAALEAAVDPDFDVEVVSVDGTEPWTWELPDGRSFDVPEATTVTVIVSGRGQDGDPTRAHIAVVDGTYRWFTFCG